MRRSVSAVSVFCFLAMSILARAQAPLTFVPMNPCRIADTRGPAGPLGGPSIDGGTTRNINPLDSNVCSIPSTAMAYSLNVTAVPGGNYLGYLTVWPTGTPRPVVSTLNSFDGRIKADAVIVGAGTSGAVSFYPTDTTDVVVDITGYFVGPMSNAGLAFYPIAPCNLVDTTAKNGDLGGPSLSAGTARPFPVNTSACLTPFPDAQAYSLNVTAIPKAPSLFYLTMWNSDFSQPVVSTLNATTGTETSNGALMLAGSGSISAYASDDTDLIIDINGYFAQPGNGGLSLYTQTPCRVLDTRAVGMGEPFTGAYGPVDVVGSGCIASSTAQAYVMNATVVPTTKLSYLTVFDSDTGVPVPQTLHALDAAVTSNIAIVAASQQTMPTGEVSAYASSPTQLILDLNAYFDTAKLTIITTPPLPSGTVSVPYTVGFTAQGGAPPYTWSEAGNLPAGLMLDPDTGVISGTPTTNGTSNFTVTVTDSNKTMFTAPFSITIAPFMNLTCCTPQGLPDGNVGVAYDQTVSATGGVTPYTWSILSGSLPTGLSLTVDKNNNAVISGTPTLVGNYSFVLMVVDSENPPATATRPYTIAIH